MQPDVTRNGAIVAGRIHIQSDIWKFPVDGSAPENIARATRITHQTGQVLAPSAAPGDKELAFLSDSGGHANLWVVNTESGELRQSRASASPAWRSGTRSGRRTAAPSCSSTRGQSWVDIRHMARQPRRQQPAQSCQSRTGRGVVARRSLGLLLDAWQLDGEAALKKIPVGGGEPVTVTTEQLRNVIGSDGSTLYYVFERPLVDGTPESRFARQRRGRPLPCRRPHPTDPRAELADRQSRPLARRQVAGAGADRRLHHQHLGAFDNDRRVAPDHRLRSRVTVIVRRVSWSSDGRFVYAAVGEADADIVMLDGLLPAGRD